VRYKKVVATAALQKEKALERLVVRVTSSEMKNFNAAAGGKGKRSKWVKNILNKFCTVV
jgi:hypothetical protein